MRISAFAEFAFSRIRSRRATGRHRAPELPARVRSGPATVPAAPPSQRRMAAPQDADHAHGHRDRGDRAGCGDRQPPPAQCAVEQHPEAEQQEQHAGQRCRNRSGSRLCSTAPTAIATPSASTMPAVAPIQTPAQLWSLARATVASMVLSPSSASTNEEMTASSTWRGSATVRTLVAVVSTVTPGPQREQQEHDGRGERDRTLRQGQPQEVSDRHGQPVHQERGDTDAGQDHPPPMTQRVRHRHELGFVAELGEKYDSETDECGGKHSKPFDASPDGRNGYGPSDIRSKVSPTACCGSPAGLFASMSTRRLGATPLR